MRPHLLSSVRSKHLAVPSHAHLPGHLLLAHSPSRRWRPWPRPGGTRLRRQRRTRPRRRRWSLQPGRLPPSRERARSYHQPRRSAARSGDGRLACLPSWSWVACCWPGSPVPCGRIRRARTGRHRRRLAPTPGSSPTRTERPRPGARAAAAPEQPGRPRPPAGSPPPPGQPRHLARTLPAPKRRHPPRGLLPQAGCRPGGGCSPTGPATTASASRPGSGPGPASATTPRSWRNKAAPGGCSPSAPRTPRPRCPGPRGTIAPGRGATSPASARFATWRARPTPVSGLRSCSSTWQLGTAAGSMSATSTSRAGPGATTSSSSPRPTSGTPPGLWPASLSKPSSRSACPASLTMVHGAWISFEDYGAMVTLATASPPFS